MLIFKKNSITVKAPSADIVKALKNLPQKSTLLNSFTESSFSFGMWDKHEYGRMHGVIHFLGTIEEQGDECIVKYSIRPDAVGLFGFLVFLLVFVYAFALFLFSNVSLIFLALSIVFPVIIFINIMGQEQTCDERLIRKLHELENNNTD